MGLLDRLKKIITFDKTYNDALSKTRSNINSLINKHKIINDEYFSDLEELLIRADVGYKNVEKIINLLKSKIKVGNITPSEANEIIVDQLFIMYVDNDNLTSKINFNSTGPTVILVVGVNGVGKTTSIAKLANILKNDHKKVLLAAADTFRAGAIDQLITWGNRLNIDVYSETDKEPASIVFDSLEKAINEKYDILIIDTAGRLQNKDNLMNELAKMNRVIANKIINAPHETLLVIDANTGQNGISQARSFKEITNITGIILTKLDSTAKGGIVLAIKDEVNLPVKYIGVGEKVEDLRPFDIEKYLYSLIMEEKE